MHRKYMNNVGKMPQKGFIEPCGRILSLTGPLVHF
jgi:hypothetical protein